MEHVSCLTHGFYRVAEEIRKHFRKVDQLISNIKKVLLKCLLRIQNFKEIIPNNAEDFTRLKFAPIISVDVKTFFFQT